MSDKRTWIIGSATDCDIVIDQSTVSGRHCRLERTAEGYWLHDLDSTNGTYMNGQQVVSPCRVVPTDRITLGQTVSMPWPETCADPLCQTITLSIGRAADNDVVVNFPNVSEHHARLIIDGQEMTIQDLDSTNGTAVGSPERKITTATVTTDDVVYLGSIPIPVSQLVEKTSAMERALQDQMHPQNTTARRARFVIIFGFVAVTALALVVLAIGLPSDGARRASDHAAGPSSKVAVDHASAGSHTDRSVQLCLNKDRHFSRHQFRLEIHPPLCYLVDLNSRNGTFVNGQRVQEAFPEDGDTISVGKTQIVVTIASDSTDTEDFARAEKLLTESESPQCEQDPAPPSETRFVRRVGGYEIQRELGRGATGIVHEAVQTATRKKVALKIIVPVHADNQRAMQTFVREGSTLSQLDHPRIVRFYEMGIADG